MIKFSGFRQNEIYAGVRFFILKLLALTIVFFLLGGCIKEERESPPAEENGTEISTAENDKPKDDKMLKAGFKEAQILWDDDQGRRILEAEFKEATASQTGDDASIELKGVNAKLYRDGEIASGLSAMRVVADSQTKVIRASGGVKLVSSLHETSAESERLTWNSSEDKVIGEGNVKVRRSNVTITASKFEADTELNKITFYNGKASVD